MVMCLVHVNVCENLIECSHQYYNCVVSEGICRDSFVFGMRLEFLNGELIFLMTINVTIGTRRPRKYNYSIPPEV